MSEKNKDFKVYFEQIEKFPKGMCPNLFLSGKSISTLERAGLNLAEKIEEKNMIAFKGMVKKFSVLMPYFEDEKDVVNFISHLKNSVSIARDCYEQYCGIVLVELSEKWSEKKINPFVLEAFLDYIKVNPQICFIMLLPVTENGTKAEEFYCELSTCSIWMKVPVETSPIQECISLFRAVAESHGYSVTEKAEEVLIEKLKQRDELYIENVEIVKQLVSQILFEHALYEEDRKIIDENEIMYIAGSTGKKEKKIRKIGFTVETQEK